MKLVHAADIHLDSPLRGLTRYPGAPVDAVRGATRAALRNLVDLCLAEEADLLLIAGDLYDGDWRDYNTGLYLSSQLARLTRSGARVVLIRGNHDAASQITRSLRLPEGAVELACSRAQSLLLEPLGVAVHGRGYPSREVREDLSAGYPEPVSGLCNIGLLHTAVNGRPGHEPYAPCSLDGLISRGYQYWALGHVHKREVLSRDPWVLFPGNLQGRHARETGPKGATLISIEDTQISEVEHRDLDLVRWEHLGLDASGIPTVGDLLDQARQALTDAAIRAGDRTLAVRLTLVGPSPAHGRLAADPERWENELRAVASDCGADIWLEKITLGTRLPLDLEALRRREDPVGELARHLAALRTDAEGLGGLVDAFANLRRRLPAEYRRLEDGLDLGDPETFAALLADVEQLLLPRLLDPREPS